MKIVCISDTHNHNVKVLVPYGDVLIHAGDFTNTGTMKEIIAFNAWFSELPHPHKIVVAGNHDFLFEKDLDFAQSMLAPGITYLQDTMVEIDGVLFHGTPWTPPFNDWAFNLDTDAIRSKFEMIPASVDVLITHGPAYGSGDVTMNHERVGSQVLRQLLREKLKPAYHIYGHIHHSYGIHSEVGGAIGVNAALCNEQYRPVQAPIVVWI